MRPIYKSLALASTVLQVSLALNAQTRDDESASTMALPADLLDSLRVELVALNVSGARNLIESGECVIDGSNLTITLDTSEWTRGAMYRLQVLATFGTQTQVIYALNITVPYYVALSDTPQEYEDDVTIVSTITDVTEADLEGLALEETSQEIKAAITPIATAAEAYNVGKTQLAAAITSKGVETSPTETYPEMAEKVNAISQETYEINGGEMYAKQLFGSLETPNYWNLYEIMAQLLSDGRLVNYGGILLAEYYKGYDSLALSGAGAGGAYVVSDKDSDGNFIMYTEDTTHTWDKEFDGRLDRWVAYCFADAGHDFEITDTNTSPRSIYIGRSVGTVKTLVNSRISKIVVLDGSSLGSIDQKGFTAQWDKQVVLRNIGSIIGNNTASLIVCSSEQFYLDADEIYDPNSADASSCINLDSQTVYIKANSIKSSLTDSASSYAFPIKISNNTKLLILDAEEISMKLINGSGSPTIDLYIINCESVSGSAYLYRNLITAKKIYFGYKDNDKTRSISLGGSASYYSGTLDCELQDGWCKPLSILPLASLTKQNVQDHIFDRLGVNDISTGTVTITLASAVLALFTQEEIDAVVERTNITIVGA